GLKMLQDCGVEVGVVSTRNSKIVQRRSEELGITLVRQGIGAKHRVLAELLEERGLASEQAGFMGDDLLDLPAMMGCGFAATVPESSEAVRRAAHYVTVNPGGRGAAREVCKFILTAQNRLEGATRRR